MLWKPELMEKCRSAGFEIFAKELSVPSEKGRSVQRFHVDIPAFDFLHQKTFAEREMVLCTTCGEFESEAFSPNVETFWFDQSRMHDIPPLFVPRTFEGVVFLSPELGRFLVELQPSGAKFEEIGLII
jgi:hypothetical protein